MPRGHHKVLLGTAAGVGKAQDIAWLLERAPGEVVVLRPDPSDRAALTGAGDQAAKRYPTPSSVRT